MHVLFVMYYCISFKFCWFVGQSLIADSVVRKFRLWLIEKNGLADSLRSSNPGFKFSCIDKSRPKNNAVFARSSRSLALANSLNCSCKTAARCISSQLACILWRPTITTSKTFRDLRYNLSGLFRKNINICCQLIRLMVLFHQRKSRYLALEF